METTYQSYRHLNSLYVNFHSLYKNAGLFDKSNMEIIYIYKEGKNSFPLVYP